MNYQNRIEELRCLSDIDESRDYEVDMSGIYTNGEKFYFIATSGCSCWDGDDYDETVYDSFEDLKKALITDDVSIYNPSLSGVKYLIETAEATFPNPPAPRVLNEDESVLNWLASNLG